MKIYAKKGEHIICENGHVICEIAKTVLTGNYQKGGELTNWRQKEPRIGDSVPLCEKCGAEFYRNNIAVDAPGLNDVKLMAGIRMHFKNGWR